MTITTKETQVFILFPSYTGVWNLSVVNPHRSPPLVINDPGISLYWLSEATDDKDRKN